METTDGFEMFLITISVFLLVSVGIYLVSVFGVKQKTFEEAIQEQKQISQILLGNKKSNKKKINSKKNCNRGNTRGSGGGSGGEEVVVNEEVVDCVENEDCDEKLKRRVEKTEITVEKLGKSGKSEVEKLEKTEKTEKSEVERVEKSEKPEKPEVEKEIEKPTKKRVQQQQTQNKKPQTASEISNLIQNTNITQEEREILIESLLNKKQDFEWNSRKESLAKKQLAEKEKQTKDLESNQIRLENSIKELKSFNNRLQEERSSFSLIIGRKDSELESLRLGLESLKKNNDELNIVKMQLITRENEWKSLEREFGALKVQYNKQGSQLSTAFNSNEDLTQKMAQLAHKSSVNEERLNSVILKNINDNNKLVENNMILLNQLNEVKVEKEKNLAKIEILKGEIDALLKEKNVFIMEGFEKEKNEFNLKIGQIQKEGKEREEKLGKRNDELHGKNVKLLETLKETENLLELKIKGLEEELVKANLVVEELKEKVKGLEGQIQLNNNDDKVAHYQEVLAGTESLLANLQASIEAEEKKWSAALAEKDEQLERYKHLESTEVEIDENKKKKNKKLSFFK